MSVPTASSKATTPEKMERELLARLGLDPSATPEDVSAAHEAVSAYLAAAPRDLRSWARTQAAGADEAYALLTDPAALARAVALVGAGARSAVLPGGPATPPAHRDSPAPAAVAVPPAATAAPALGTPRYDEDGRRIVTDDEIDALLAEVDPERPSRGRGNRRSARGRPGGRAAGDRPGRQCAEQPPRLQGLPQPGPGRRDGGRHRDRRRRRLRLRRHRRPGYRQQPRRGRQPGCQRRGAGPGEGRRADGQDPGRTRRTRTR